MPGSPKKRRKREAAARGETTAEPLHRGGARDAPAPPAPTRPRGEHPDPAPRGPSPGPAQRAVVDRQAADQLQQLAEVLQPGVMCKITRVRPRWCSGDLEDYELEEGNLQELGEYIREEWGGERFHVVILHPNGAPAFTTTFNIAGPPLDEGRRITRRSWRAMINGEDETAPVTAQAPAGASSMDNTILGHLLGPNGVLQTVMTTGKDSGDRAVAAMERMSADTKQVVADLVIAVSAQADKARESNSLGGQLKDLGSSLNAVEEIKETIAATIPEAPAPAEDTSGLNNLAQQLFMKKVMMSIDGDGGGDGRPKKRTPPGQRRRRGKSNGVNGIPPAQPGGHESN